MNMKTVILIATAALLTQPVFANVDPGPAFKGVSKKLGKCYSREYSSDHLKKHPKQTVAKMAAKFSMTTFDDGESFPILKIQAKTKNDSVVYAVELFCHEYKGKTQCNIDCDGPSVKAYFSKNNPGSMLIDNTEGRLVLDPVSCGDGVSEEEIEAMTLFLNSVKGGDDIFRLDPMADYQCL